MKRRSTNGRDWYAIGGALFGIWGLANTLNSGLRYGWDQGVYWWFCNLALLGTAWGLRQRHRGWLTGFLSIACFTQVFWVADNLIRLVFGMRALGLVDFLYRPGMGLFEFLLAHYHYFTIPVSILALSFLERKKSNALQLVLFFNPFIFGVSYFVFPAAQNINCIHEPCVASLQNWAGPVYSVSFWAVIFAAHIACVVAWEHFFLTFRFTPAYRRNLRTAFAGFCILALGLTAWDTQYKLSLPSLQCQADREDENTRIGCDYTLDHSPGNLVFRYSVKNKRDRALVCETRARTQYSDFVLGKGIVIPAGGRLQLERVLPYPDVSVQVSLLAQCQPSGGRVPASIPNVAPRLRDAR